MPRFTNSLTGSVVNVDDESAKNLGPEYSPVKAESDEKPTTRRTSK